MECAGGGKGGRVGQPPREPAAGRAPPGRVLDTEWEAAAAAAEQCVHDALGGRRIQPRVRVLQHLDALTEGALEGGAAILAEAEGLLLDDHQPDDTAGADIALDDFDDDPFADLDAVLAADPSVEPPAEPAPGAFLARLEQERELREAGVMAQQAGDQDWEDAIHQTFPTPPDSPEEGVSSQDRRCRAAGQPGAV